MRKVKCMHCGNDVKIKYNGVIRCEKCSSIMFLSDSVAYEIVRAAINIILIVMLIIYTGNYSEGSALHTAAAIAVASAAEWLIMTVVNHIAYRLMKKRNK